MNISISPKDDFLTVLRTLHTKLGVFRYHTLMNILFAAEYKRKLGDTGLPLKTVCEILNIAHEKFQIDTSKLFEKRMEEEKGKDSDKHWIKFSPAFLRWIQETDYHQCGCSDMENDSLLPDEQAGHSILHAHCETRVSYSKTAFLFHIQGRKQYNTAMLKSSFTAAETFGRLGSKVRLLAAFCQCLFYLPVVFEIPWPQALLDLISILQILTTDILVPIMALSCRLRADYFSYFYMKMAVIPVGIGVAFLADRAVNLWLDRTKSSCEKPASDVFFETVDFIVYMSYAQVCSSLFMYFRCKPVQDHFYLVADMRVTCWHGAWRSNEAAAVFFILLYMLGIPLLQFFVLCCNRQYLHEKNDDPKRHDRVIRRFGSLYQEFTRSCWWVRPVEGVQRLALTGGVVLFGDYSVSRLLGGVIVSIFWLLLLIYLHPYKARLDNLLAMILSLELILTLVVGMALELYTKTRNEHLMQAQDSFQKDSYGFLLFLSNATIIIIGLVAITISIPFVRKKLMHCRDWCFTKFQKKRTVWGPAYNSFVRCLKSSICSFICCGYGNTLRMVKEGKDGTRAATKEFEMHVLATDVENQYDDVAGRTKEQKVTDPTLPTIEIMKTVENCQVLFSFGSANGGLKLAKILRDRLKKEPGWGRPSTAYIDNQDLLDRADTVLTPWENVDKTPVLDCDGDPIIKVTNPHWAEFYYGAMTYAQVVVILWDKVWHESKWCQGEWQLFLKHALEVYADDQFDEQQAYSFDIVIVFHSNPSLDLVGKERELLAVTNTLIDLELPHSLLKKVQLIPAIIQGAKTCIETDDLNNFVRICLESVSTAADERKNKEGGETKSSITDNERVKAHMIMYDKFWKKKALDVQVARPDGYAYWWEHARLLQERAQAYQATVDDDEGGKSHEGSHLASERSHSHQEEVIHVCATSVRIINPATTMGKSQVTSVSGERENTHSVTSPKSNDEGIWAAFDEMSSFKKEQPQKRKKKKKKKAKTLIMPTPPPPPRREVNRLVALYNFEAQEKNELPLRRGQIVIGHSIDEEGWWTGEDPSTGERGHFPENFVAQEGSEKAEKVLRKLSRKKRKGGKEVPG